MSQLPPGYVRYAEAYPPGLRYLYQPAPLPRRRTGLKVALAILVTLAVGAGLGYFYARPFLVEFPATLTMPESVAGMPRLTDARFQEISDAMTSFLRDRAGADSSIAAFYAPVGSPARAVLVSAGTGFVLHPAGALDDGLAGFAKGSGLTVTDVTSTGPGVLGGVAKCGQTQMLAVCAWADHGSVGAVVGFSRTIPETADLLRTVRPLVLHRH